MRAILVLLIIIFAFGIGSLLANDVSITVYNNNLGVVHEKRDLTFENGIGKISYVDVPSRIDPTSVGFKIVDLYHYRLRFIVDLNARPCKSILLIAWTGIPLGIVTILIIRHDCAIEIRKSCHVDYA